MNSNRIVKNLRIIPLFLVLMHILLEKTLYPDMSFSGKILILGSILIFSLGLLFLLQKKNMLTLSKQRILIGVFSVFISILIFIQYVDW